MSILEFNSRRQFMKYCSKRFREKDFIDSGTEGNCYLGKDNYAYKILFDEDFGFDYSIDTIITEDDFYSRCFYFPKDLFTINSMVAGYRSRAAHKDLFKSRSHFKKNLLINEPQFEKIDFNALIDAYFEMQDEIKLLTDNHISINDLSYNLIFDGKTLIGIDTCHYDKNFNITLEDNQRLLDQAIKDAFSFLLINSNFSDLNSDINTIDFLKELGKVKIKSKKL